MEPMQAEKIPSNVQEIPGQEDTLETLTAARERLNETLDAVRQRAGEACEYTDQVDLPLFKHTFVLRPRAEEPL